MKSSLHKLILLIPFIVVGTANAELPRVEGLTLDGNVLSWDAQEGASGYNIHRDYDYFDTVRDATQYTLSEPGNYHVISFNDAGEFGVTRNPDEIGQQYIFVEYTGSEDDDTVSYDSSYNVLIVTKTCTDVGPGETCIASCPTSYESEYGGTHYIEFLSGGACSTSDIVEADAAVSPETYRCTVPTFSGEVTAQAICVPYR